MLSVYAYTYNIQNLGLISFSYVCFKWFSGWISFLSDPLLLALASFISLFNVNTFPTTQFICVCLYGSFLCLCTIGIWGWCSVAFWTLSPHCTSLFTQSLLFILISVTMWTVYEGYFRNSPLDSWCLFHSDILIFLSCECQVDIRDTVTLISPKQSFLPLLISLWLVSLV